MAPVQEPAGLWLQGCGGWDDQDEQVASSWWAARKDKKDKEAIKEIFDSDSDLPGAAGPQQQQPGMALGRGAAAAPASPSAAAAAAPASRGVPQPEVIDLLVDDEDEEVAPGQPPPEQAQQQAPAVEPAPQQPQHEASPEPPAAAARMRRFTHKQVHPPAQKRRQPRPAAPLEEALPLSRGRAAAIGGSLQREDEAAESEEEADEKAWRLPGHQWVLRGDIGGPPPHRPRDLLVLNTVIPYRRQFRAVTRAYQQRMQGALGERWGVIREAQAAAPCTLCQTLAAGFPGQHPAPVGNALHPVPIPAENPTLFPPVVAAATKYVPTETERLKAGKAIEDYIKQ